MHSVFCLLCTSGDYYQSMKMIEFQHVGDVTVCSINSLFACRRNSNESMEQNFLKQFCYHAHFVFEKSKRLIQYSGCLMVASLPSEYLILIQYSSAFLVICH